MPTPVTGSGRRTFLLQHVVVERVDFRILGQAPRQTRAGTNSRFRSPSASIGSRDSAGANSQSGVHGREVSRRHPSERFLNRTEDFRAIQSRMQGQLGGGDEAVSLVLPLRPSRRTGRSSAGRRGRTSSRRGGANGKAKSSRRSTTPMQ